MTDLNQSSASALSDLDIVRLSSQLVRSHLASHWADVEAYWDVHAGATSLPAFGPVAYAIDHQLAPLRNLPYDWDSYGGRPLDRRVAEIARRFLTWIAIEGRPAPFIVPTPTGGLSVEWRRGNRELILEFAGVAPASSVSVYFADDDAGSEWEMPFPGDGRFLPALATMEG